jgi:hypothetical protein
MKNPSSSTRWATGAILVGSAAVLMIARPSAKNEHAELAPAIVAPVAKDPALETLRNELTALRRELDEVKLERPHARRTDEARAAPPSEPARNEKKVKLSIAEKIAEEERRVEDAIFALDLQLASEIRDVVWSDELEDEIRRLAELGSDTQTIALECLQTVCRAELRHRDLAARDRFTEDLYSSRKIAGPGLFRPFNAGDGSPSTLLYLRRRGYPIPSGRS